MRIAFLGNFSESFTSETHHAASLEQLGHEVVRIQEPQPSGHHVYAAAANCELFCWVHTHGWHTPGIAQTIATLKTRRIPCITFHLDLWLGLGRERDMQTDPYWTLDHFFTVDRRMADYLNAQTPVKGHYLPAGVYGAECYLAPAKHPQREVIFVGSRGYHPEWPYRPQLIDWLKQTYGNRFTHVGRDGDIGTVRGDDLNRLYANSKVVVGDSLCLNYTYPDYWSDRVYETCGRGGMIIHPYVDGMERHFVDGLDLRFYKYGDFDQLKSLIDHYLKNTDEREHIRRQGHEHVKANHTYVNRWQTILETLGC